MFCFCFLFWVWFKNSETRTHLTGLSQVSVLHGWQIKTDISGGTQRNREVDAHYSSLIFLHINTNCFVIPYIWQGCEELLTFDPQLGEYKNCVPVPFQASSVFSSQKSALLKSSDPNSSGVWVNGNFSSSWNNGTNGYRDY